MWVQAMVTGMGNGLTIRVVVFTFIFFKGNLLTATFTTTPGVIQQLVRLPLAYYMSIQPHASLTNIGLAAPTATTFGIILNICFFFHLQKKLNAA